jgi:hypothetical protein
VAITKINKLPDNVVTSAKIADNTVVNADINSCAAIAQSKLSGLTTSLNNICSSVTSATADNSKNAFNIGLLGFKMAVNESLTVFNLIDGVVDEFNDESGTDEAEGTNDTYCGTSDYYTNLICVPSTFSAGFSTTAATEPDTSTAGTNPSDGTGTFGSFTVPTGATSATVYLWGGGGHGSGGSGGYTTGTLAISASQVVEVVVGEATQSSGIGSLGGGGLKTPAPPSTLGNNGGGLSGIFTNCEGFPALQGSAPKAPQIYMIAGGGGGGGHGVGKGGGGGGLTGCAGNTSSEQTGLGPSPNGAPAVGGGGGDQEQGGQGNSAPQNGSFLTGAANAAVPSGCFKGGTGGGGYYGGGAGGSVSGPQALAGGGGGGSSYYGHPQVSGTSTEEGAIYPGESGGAASPVYACTSSPQCGTAGDSQNDGYVLLTGGYCVATTSSTTIVSSAFSSTSVATNARIVVFEENVDTPTLNTDIIASVSRDGTNFTNATLSDSGYVTGSSGQRVLTGQVDISGQPSGQSMRWKLQLANNQVKIHGVSLSWA